MKNSPVKSQDMAFWALLAVAVWLLFFRTASKKTEKCCGGVIA